MAEFVYQMYKARKAVGEKVILDDSFASFVHLIDKLCHVLLLKGLSDEIFT